MNSDGLDKLLDASLPDLFTPEEWHQLAIHFALSPRQIEIARLICLGCTTSELADMLQLKPDTIRMHRKVLYRRLNIGDRVGVPVRLAAAIRSGHLGGHRRHA